MFAIPCLFSLFVGDTQQMKLIQLLKQFERRASLGMAVHNWPLVANSFLSRHKNGVQRQLLFTENNVNVFKMQPIPTVSEYNCKSSYGNSTELSSAGVQGFLCYGVIAGVTG